MPTVLFAGMKWYLRAWIGLPRLTLTILINIASRCFGTYIGITCWTSHTPVQHDLCGSSIVNSIAIFLSCQFESAFWNILCVFIISHHNLHKNKAAVATGRCRSVCFEIIMILLLSSHITSGDNSGTARSQQRFSNIYWPPCKLL